ncbi:MAG: hypothetical protein H7Z41_12265 [Cytophagales bacterium]|nr:hypothetical protein [Armatimonadota bacterium]
MSFTVSKFSMVAPTLILLGSVITMPRAANPFRGGLESNPYQSAPVLDEGAAETRSSSSADSSVKAAFTAAYRQANTALKAGRAPEAAKLLKPFKVSTLDPLDARRWRTLAAAAAVRTGDAKWLREINDDPESFTISLDLMLLTAQRLVQGNKLEDARTLLKQIRDPQSLDEVPRRRYLELMARLEQLSGNATKERVYIAKLVEFAGSWPADRCQACHANPRLYGDEVTTTIDIAEWWAGDRFATLIRQQGDAASVKAAATKRLAADPSDASARLRLAYSLRALGNEEQATATLRALPWAEFPDREKRTPLRLAPFP